MKPTSPTRMGYLDHLRIFVTILVVAHHAGQAYGPTGGEWPVFEDVRAAWLGPFFATNAAWFMGLFFLLSGYFTPTSYDRKGPGAFLKDRFIRLGVPIVLFWSPFIGIFHYAHAQTQLSLPAWLLLEYVLGGKVEVGHLWFLLHLLVYSLIYSGYRVLRGAGSAQPAVGPPSGVQLVAYGLILALVTYAVRLWFPIDRWVWIGGVIPSEVAHLPQYVSLFFIGTLAGRNRWFETIPTASGLRWFGVAMATIVFAYLFFLGLRRFIPIPFETGGPEVGALNYSLLESVICVGICFGLPIVFRQWFNTSSEFLKQLAAGSYTVYIIHFLFLVAIQYQLLSFHFSPTVKFLIATVTCTLLCYLFAFLVRKVPGATRIL